MVYMIVADFKDLSLKMRTNIFINFPLVFNI